MSNPSGGAEWFEGIERPVAGYSEALSDNDRMWRGDELAYISVGQSAVRCVRIALAAADVAPSAVRRVLDFPCGHGRVMRFLKADLPHAQFTGGDLNRDGVDFCAASFGATPMYSHDDLARIEFPDQYELIWCGSLLTHLDAPQWPELMGVFERALAPNGVAVVTVHGPGIAENMRQGWNYGLEPAQLLQLCKDCRTTGFGFKRQAADREYGISMSRPSWVLEQVERRRQLRTVAYVERGWDNHQDVLVVQKARHTAPVGPYAERHARFDWG